MNKVITDGLVLMPASFAAGLGQWSRGDGVPGSDTYAMSGAGSFVPADQDFGAALEIQKTTATQKIRYMVATPMLPGLYLRIKARVKAIAGALPAVQIAGYPTNGSGGAISGLTVTAAPTQLTAYGQVVEVSAIVGTGLRGGVNMYWPSAAYGYFGINFTGPNGAILRIDDIEIEDITHVFLRDMLAQVDVRDYGARGDGVTNDAPAFAAADAAAAGREVFVPAGSYFLDADVTLQSRVRFEGKVIVPDARRFILQSNFDLPSYVDAFGDEEQAFRKAWQALLNNADHEGLDMGGRRVTLTRPLDMQACDPSRTTFAQRRVIRNGCFQPDEGTAWLSDVITAQATYSAANPTQLTGIAAIGAIQRGSLVTGAGVGREVYVTEVNPANNSLTLSAELYDAEGTQQFTFTRFKYLLDFSGYETLTQVVLSDIDFQCLSRASGVMLARGGVAFHIRDCFFTRPQDRGITSIGRGCQGLLIDRCQFLSAEQHLPVSSRVSIGFNTNANDLKLRDNRAVMFRHFGVMAGSGNIVSNNHFFAGDSEGTGIRFGGLVITLPNPRMTIVGNYIDNNSIEWTNEHSSSPALGNQFSFSGLTITGNNFTAGNVATWFSWIVIKPYGAGHYIQGLTVNDNVFRTIAGTVERVERVDTTFADLDFSRIRNVQFTGNVFNAVTNETRNPLSVTHSQTSESRTWLISGGSNLPFNGRLRTVEALVPLGAITTSNGGSVYESPLVDVEYGTGNRQARLTFGATCKGTMRCLVRMDNPN
ncbi:glycosyl hydrolase family 28-related protein [Ketogulonicigenium vulgare]|uniref:Rhamnogalacturonase A/B/Epimerase-like pectate lyase domain-containing protein n=1 Tax=Ketogulonicigenium vulgare (strain WSH-001) TaxID=759362 RepID=F9Y9Y8_KETVW|nr:glycosyl hydrolase family 28-related protein [Ketogulonicigenium vulgare]ADO42022.1 conserved hypothetical protein [Ketogulonicigenium vulgare Y25]AEM40240.1 hypothetical protein KVU_0401 [Ketogulonicigenium vulgare WSH-001]ALJ80441.1 hypothetical protein KVH_04165 [Ketogulonicigenium vulgare]ANW33268.1 hypothetical protein KvSKV_04135 [Ketogulonicigenium vulgare]AOZ53947.1 hypothetical protein KVC_0930 [Ketogulonicigenium vulgare]